VRIELRPEKPLPPDAKEEQKREQAHKNLILIGAFLQLCRLTEERTDEAAKILLALTRHESARVREGVATFVGAFAAGVAALQDPKQDEPSLYVFPWRDFEFDPLNPKGKPRETRQEAARRLTKVVNRLRDVKLEAALRQLREDPEAPVRAAAETALKQLAAVKAKQP
jgi:hypothetical protein